MILNLYLIFFMLDKKRLWEGYVVVVNLNILDNLLFKYKKVTILQDFFSVKSGRYFFFSDSMFEEPKCNRNVSSAENFWH